MLILGLLLLLAAGALTAGMLLGNTKDIPVEVFGYKPDYLSGGEVFLVGIAVGIVAGLSLTLVLSGMGRASRKRRERRAELKEKLSREQELQEENARLARELDQQRRNSASTSAPGRPDGPGGADAARPMTSPQAGSSPGDTGFERPSSPAGQPPRSTTDSSQEGRRPLS